MKVQRTVWTKIMLALTLVMMLAVGCFFAACDNTPAEPTPPDDGNTPTTPVDKNENITSVFGTYSHFLGYETLVGSLPARYGTGVTDDSEFYQYSTLTLFSDESGNRFILTRNLHQTYLDFHFFQQYEGSFTWDTGSRDVILQTPDEYSYSYDFGQTAEITGGGGSGVRGASHIKVDLSQEAIDEGRTIEQDDGTYTFPGEIEFGQGIDGAGLYGFNNEVADYHNRGGMYEMTLTLDLNTMEFVYNFGD